MAPFVGSVLLSALCWAALVVAAPEVARADPPELEAAPLRADETIAVDGALDGPAWDRAERAGAFAERVPHPGASPPVATTFRVLHDARAIDFGIEAGLGGRRDTAGLRAHPRRRGAQLR